MNSDLIFVSMENWDEIWRRNQFVCAELVRRHPQMKVLFVGVQRNVWHYIARGRVGSLFRDATRAVPDLPRIRMLRPLRVGLERFHSGRVINQTIARRQIAELQKSLGIRNPVLWINPHSAVNLADEFDAAAVIYDITDDWTTSSQTPEFAEVVRKQDAELCRKADATIVCSQRLFDLKRGLAQSLYLIPNGVDAEHYRQVLDGAGPLQPAAAKWTKPVYGYTGSVHTDRVDVELVRQFALQTKGTIVLLGPDMLPPDAKARLALPNVVIFGQVPYHDLPQYMRTFDVCIVPHRMTAFTESLNPIKLWEYLAAGKPIVSTDVAGFRDYPQFVKIARTSEQFVTAAADALTESVELPPARRAEARKHSWASRVDEIERVIDAAIERRSQRNGHER